MSNTTVVKSGGIGFFGMLQLTLIVLKIMGFITASWFVVLLPIIIPVIIFLLIIGGMAVFLPGFRR